LITLLNNKNQDMAEDIVRLQKASYKVEAELIGYMQIPPLLEVSEDIMESQETYYGYFVDGDLAGIISYIIEDGVLDICKVAVHPDYFKKGIARQLLQLTEKMDGINKITVSTGKANRPAVNLYLSQGFVKTREFEVEKGLFIASFEKQVGYNE